MNQKEFNTQMRDAQQRITGKVFCASGQHFVPSDWIIRSKPRPQCKLCAERIDFKRREQPPAKARE